MSYLQKIKYLLLLLLLIYDEIISLIFALNIQLNQEN